MGKPTGFIEIDKLERGYKSVAERLQNYNEFVTELTDSELSEQGARCMDCGIPFCHQGCPVNNLIPDWNDLVYQKDWQEALVVLHSTNNFPEFTGKICPAPCESSCTLNIDDNPVSIRTIECAIVDKGFANGWIKPEIASVKTGKKVAIIGSGPAGLAAAQQLCRAGHEVTLYEKEPVAGGLLRLGIPDFKLDKAIVQRRIDQLVAEGVNLKLNTNIGEDIEFSDIETNNDAVVLAGGSEKPRDLPIPGRDLKGIYFAMDFLKSNSKKVQGLSDNLINANNKHVVVIGGGDTGSDCVGTSNRHGASNITQLEITPKPPVKEDKDLVWPDWPNKLRTSSSQEEGCDRMWQVATKEFIGDSDGNLTAIKCIKVEWSQVEGNWNMTEVSGSEFEIKADMVMLAMGFVHPIYSGLLEQSGVELDSIGNVSAEFDGDNSFETSVAKVFSAGDMRRGQSLVVHAINEGRKCAKAVDLYLTGSTNLS